MDVRTASETDFRQYLQWFDQAESSRYATDIEQLVMVLDGSTPVAGAMMTLSPSQEIDYLWTDVEPSVHETHVYLRLMRFAVEPGGTTIGRDVLAAFEGHARSLGCSGVRLDCDVLKQSHKQFYLDAGYFPRGESQISGARVLRLDKDLQANLELTAMLPGWEADLVGTLLFVVNDGKVLLIRKKRGHGAGKINGPGGKLEGEETPSDCAMRETLEEVGIQAIEPKLRGVMRFVDTVDPQWLGYIFVAEAFRGEPRETDEAIPLWFSIEEIPYDEMWEDDRLWLPHVLGGERVEGDFLFTRGHLRAHRLTTNVDDMSRMSQSGNKPNRG